MSTSPKHCDEWHHGWSNDVFFLFLQNVKSKLNAVCNEIGLLKSACRKFVKTHLGELIEELTTSDDVRTICVNTGACK